MRILVTGACGQLGMSLRKISGEYPAHEFLFTDLPGADITDRGAMDSLAGGFGPEAVVNCAAYTAVDAAETDAATARKVNFEGAAIVSEICRSNGIKLVHISTDYVFDGASRTPYKEDDRPNPLNVYGCTKLEGERAVLESGAEAVIIRTSWLYSEFGPNFAGKMYALAAGGGSARVVDDQTGSPTYAGDLARAVMAVLESGISGVKIYNYAGLGETTWYGLAREIFLLAGGGSVTPVKTGEYPAAAKRPARSVLDTSKIRQLGIIPRPWRESLAECVAVLSKKS